MYLLCFLVDDGFNFLKIEYDNLAKYEIILILGIFFEYFNEDKKTK